MRISRTLPLHYVFVTGVLLIAVVTFIVATIWKRQSDNVEIVHHVIYSVLPTPSSVKRIQINIEDLGITLIQLKPAYVRIGSPQSEWMHSDTEPKYQSHAVTSYLISETEISNDLFGLFIQDGGYECDSYWGSGESIDSIRSRGHPKYWSKMITGNNNSGSLPVVGVSLYEAEAFCEWLEDTTNLPFSLPSEEQWEYAAEGSTGSGVSVLFPWGDAGVLGIGDTEDWKLCNTDLNVGLDVYKGVSPCGAMKSDISWCGCMDLAGNVSEWCYASFIDGVLYTMDIGKPSLEYRGTLKGGSYLHGSKAITTQYFRNSARLSKKAVYSSRNIGFRVVINTDMRDILK